MFSLPSKQIRKNYTERTSSIHLIINNLDDKIQTIEKTAKIAGRKLHRKGGLLSYFQSEGTSSRERMIQDLRQEFQEVKEFSARLEKTQEEAVVLTEELLRADEPAKKLSLKREIIARQEIIAQMEVRLFQHMDHLQKVTGDDETLEEKIVNFAADVDHEVKQTIADERKFFTIQSLFERVHHTREDSVESRRLILAKKQDLEQFLQNNPFPDQSALDLPDLLDMLTERIDFIQKCIDQKKILELNEPLTNDEVKELKLSLYEVKINFLEIKIENRFLEGREKIPVLEKTLRSLREQKRALLEVSRLTEEESLLAVRWMGKILSAAIDASNRIYGSVIGTERHNYKWETKPWGKLLVGDDDPFTSSFFRSVNATKEAVKQLDARLIVLEKELAGVSEDIDKGKWALPKYGKDKLEIKKSWVLKRERLQEKIDELKSDRTELKIALRSLFIQKINQEIGERTQRIHTLQASQEEIQENITTLKEAEPDPENASLIKNLKREFEKTGQEIERLKEESEILIRGFQLQMEKYQKLSPPSRSLMEALKNYGIGQVKDFISMGYLNSGYITSHQLEVDHAFARYGYHWLEGLKEFAVEDSPSIQYFMSSQVQRFVEFADEYPNVAILLAPDVAVTVSRLGGKGPLNYFQKRMKSKCYAQALLYQLGRTAKTKQLITADEYEKAKKWKAFADLVKAGPVAAANIEVFNEAWEGFKKGNLIEMITGPLAKSMESRIDALNLRNTIKLFSPEGDRLATEIQKILSGEESQEIVQIEHNISLVKWVGKTGKTRNHEEYTDAFPSDLKTVANQFAMQYVNALEKRGILFRALPDEALSIIPEDVRIVLDYQIKRMANDLVHRLNEEHMRKLQKKEKLSTKDIRKMTLFEANIPKLKAQVHAVINEKFQGKHALPNDTYEDVMNYALNGIAGTIRNDWLNDVTRKAVENELNSIWKDYESPNRYLIVDPSEKKYGGPKQFIAVKKPIAEKSKLNLYKLIRAQLAGKMVRVEKTRDVIVDRLMEEFGLNVY